MIPGVDHSNTHIATAAIVTGGLIMISLAARVSLGEGETAVIPAGRFSLKGIFESLTEFIVGLTETVLGHGSERYAPLFASIFTFILVNNLVGLLPGMTPATDNINTTFAIGIFSFLVYNYVGISSRGIKYYEDFTGHLPKSLFLMWLLMIPIELLSHVFRPLSLGLRLMGNMTGDHAVVGFFLEILPAPFVYFIPMVFYALGLLVCFIQALVFTLLSMTYVMMAQPQDDH
jgi:F-type H+-transporting ATPase subunit a